MRDDFFTFKQFRVLHRKSIMKVGTDGVLLGAYVDCKNANRILDIGTGTGLLCLMLAQKCDATIHGVEINAEAVEVAKFNVGQSNWRERIEIFHSSVQDFSPEEKYDLIVSNPPFYTTDVVVEEQEFAESKNAAGSGSDNAGFVPADQAAASGDPGDGFMNIPDGIDEELPFN